jgi:hypothetical protein
MSKEGPWPISALKGELSDKIPTNVIVRWDRLYDSHHHRDMAQLNKVSTDTHCRSDGQVEPPSVHNIQYVHDKEERKHLLDGTGEGFPAPPAADSIHPDEN